MHGMNQQQAEVYDRVLAFRFDPEGTAYTFSDRLAKENGWSAGFTARVVEEYRKFAFLAAAAGHPVSPSHAVDEAWHLHLVYTRSYWDEFCGKVLRTPLHHEPSTGGDDVRSDIKVAPGIGEGARQRMKSGKRVVVRFTPTSATFVPGMQSS